MELLHRFRGCMLGLAAGDAFGAPLDGLAPQVIHERHGKISTLKAGGRHDMDAGEGTDVTAQLLLAAGNPDTAAAPRGAGEPVTAGQRR